MARKKLMFESEAARQLFDKTVSTFELDQHHIETLKLCCDCLDRITAAQGALHKDGDIIKDRYGCPKAHPAARMLEQNKVIYARLLRELKLDENPQSHETEV